MVVKDRPSPWSRRGVNTRLIFHPLKSNSYLIHKFSSSTFVSSTILLLTGVFDGKCGDVWLYSLSLWSVEAEGWMVMWWEPGVWSLWASVSLSANERVPPEAFESLELSVSVIPPQCCCGRMLASASGSPHVLCFLLCVLALKGGGSDREAVALT